MSTKLRYRSVNSNLLGYMLLVSIYTISIHNVFSQGDLLVFPKRVFLEGKKKVEELNLSNTGKDTAVYNISFVQYKMNENGDFILINEPEEGQHFASPFLRVFPRKVKLAPNESQTVKVQLTNTNELLESEYRSHLYFRAEKNNKPLGDESKNIDTTSISVKLEAVYGISIACIIRNGANNTTISISDLHYNKSKAGEDLIHLKLNRTGNMSAYGDFKILYTAPNNTTYEVAKLQGVAVYTPNLHRNIKIKLNKPENIAFIGGSFTVVFTQNESKKVLAEAVMAL